MTERSVTHDMFVIERTYDAAPERVFTAWADPAVKARWFAGPEEWGAPEFEMDFRVGGREVSRGGPPDGPQYAMEARYWDIVPNERIVSTYDMHMNQMRISVSLATVEFTPAGTGTRLVYTEQAVFLDGHDNAAERERGTRDLLDALDAALRRASATV